MEEEQDEGGSPAQALELTYLKAAFLAMEPADFVVSLARRSGGGLLTEGVQNFIMENCIRYMMNKKCTSSRGYTRNILKKLISSAESSGNAVLEDLYEVYAHYISPIKEDVSLKHGTKNLKSISFFCSNGFHEGSDSVNFVVPIQCSTNILEGDTGCSIWPSSLFLSEFILSYPNLFCNKVCLELGAGVGLVGIILHKVKASKVILTDGDLSTLENMQANLEINHLGNSNEIECRHLLWEVASEMEIASYDPDIVVGADIIYDPLCLPPLVRVLSLLLEPRRPPGSTLHEGDAAPAGGGLTSDSEEMRVGGGDPVRAPPVAYIAVVVRNVETFGCFMELAGGAHLAAVDLTGEMQPSHLLPYMGSYDRAGVRMYRVSCSRS